MPRQPEELTRHNILLFKGDFTRLDELYQHRSATDVVRTLVRKHIEAVEAKEKEKAHAQTW